MKIIIFILSVLFLGGCGTIQQTTTTETEGQILPAVVVYDTVFYPFPYEVLVKDGIDIDSAQRAFFLEHCKGTVEIERDGLKARISFLARDNKEKAETVIQLTSEIEKKEQVIQTIKKITDTKTTPSDWWIFWASLKFWLPFSVLGIFIGAIGMIVLRLKTSLLSKLIP
jgi:uncharacterized protein YceK